MADRAHSFPEPDLYVVAEGKEPRKRRGKGQCGEETVLIVEVSGSLLRRDLEVKRKLYARAGVPEYWVLDINARRLIVQTQPKPDGTYSLVKRLRDTEKINGLAIAEMLP